MNDIWRMVGDVSYWLSTYVFKPLSMDCQETKMNK